MPQQVFALGMHDAHLLNGITAWQPERLLGKSPLVGCAEDNEHPLC